MKAIDAKQKQKTMYFLCKKRLPTNPRFVLYDIRYVMRRREIACGTEVRAGFTFWRQSLWLLVSRQQPVQVWQQAWLRWH